MRRGELRGKISSVCSDDAKDEIVSSFVAWLLLWSSSFFRGSGARASPWPGGRGWLTKMAIKYLSATRFGHLSLALVTPTSLVALRLLTVFDLVLAGLMLLYRSRLVSCPFCHASCLLSFLKR